MEGSGSGGSERKGCRGEGMVASGSDAEGMVVSGSDAEERDSGRAEAMPRGWW